MTDRYISHSIDRDIVSDVNQDAALTQLVNGMLELLQVAKEHCPRREACTASMVCNVIDLTAVVQVGCMADPTLKCPMDNRAEVESDVMDIIDGIE